MKILAALFAVLILSACAKNGTPIFAGRVTGALAAGDGEVLVPRVYFAFDSDIVLPEAAAKIDVNVEWMKKNPLSYIILEGHCDEAGPDEYNMELGDRRGRSVEAYLIEKGMPAERIIMVVSYGEERPLSKGRSAEDLRKNRRVEFVVR